MRRCSRIVVRGKVQGVLYRDFVKKSAQVLDIEGTVQNANDGSVIINACGTKEKLDDFIDSLYEGPKKSQVQQVEEEPITHGRDFRGVFRIIGSS